MLVVRTYKVLITASGEVKERQFDTSHARALSLPAEQITENGGLELRDALMLFNRWNRNSRGRFVYWVEEEV